MQIQEDRHRDHGLAEPWYDPESIVSDGELNDNAPCLSAQSTGGPGKHEILPDGIQEPARRRKCAIMVVAALGCILGLALTIHVEPRTRAARESFVGLAAVDTPAPAPPPPSAVQPCQNLNGSADSAEALQSQTLCMQQMLADAQAKLDTISKKTDELAESNQAEALDFDVQKAQQKLETVLTSDAFLSGEELPPLQLVERHKMLMGVLLYPDESVLGKQQVVALKTESAVKEFSPEEEQAEFKLETSNASDMKRAMRQVETSGGSSCSVSKIGGFIGVSAMGSSGVNAGRGQSPSDCSTLSQERDRAKSSGEAVKTWQATKYFFEPRMSVMIPRGSVEYTADFSEALKRVADEERTGYTVQHLLREFGSHVCLEQALGAWWKVSASFTSTSNTSALESSTKALEAIENTVSEAMTAGFDVPLPYGIDAGAQMKGSGSKDTSRSANYSENVEVSQTWNGGITSGSVGLWRQSLGPKRSSNWKVIDRT